MTTDAQGRYTPVLADGLFVPATRGSRRFTTPRGGGSTARLFMAFCVIWVCAQAGPTRAFQQGARPVNRDALILEDFKERVKQYVDLRKSLQKDAPKLKETKNPADITVAQKALADKLRAARRDARPGDIFTPDVRAQFRRLMYPELKGPDRQETKATIKDDAPAKVPLKVNALYPETAPLPTVPPNLLANLPQLPEELEYRIVGQHLILRDVDANIIVDYIPNAIQ